MSVLEPACAPALVAAAHRCRWLAAHGCRWLAAHWVPVAGGARVLAAGGALVQGPACLYRFLLRKARRWKVMVGNGPTDAGAFPSPILVAGLVVVSAAGGPAGHFFSLSCVSMGSVDSPAVQQMRGAEML